MSRSIYEEALEIIDLGFDTWDRAKRLEFVKHALEQAQKQEQLLELYKKIYNGITDYHDYDELSELQKQIKEIENE